MARGDQSIDHLLRRAGFGASTAELAAYNGQSLSAAIESLIEYERLPDDVDSKIGQSAYVGITTRGQFSPNANIDDARQRWLFRMVHSQRPLQEKMALFWHNHFATAYSKVAGAFGSVQGVRMMAAKSGELPGPQGQLELFRQFALGKFRELLVAVARDPAMVIWLDGRTNTRTRPQENFGREIMELFTLGIGNYTEQDVKAAARAFTGYNVQRGAGTDNNDPNTYYQFVFNANQHETTAKEFTFPIYANGSRTIPARAAAEGLQDGVDLANALALHPQTARRLAGRLWSFFVSELVAPDEAFLAEIAAVYLQNDTALKPVMNHILRSRWFWDSRYYYSRYSWPAEFVARSIKEVGWSGFSVDTARTPLVNMGQTLFEPPDVNGWELGRGWFSTGTMLARMNFASTLSSNQRFNLARDVTATAKQTPDAIVQYFLGRCSPTQYDGEPYDALVSYVGDGLTWTGSDTQVSTKAPSVVRLIVGSSEYQFV